jgi:oxidoreductase AflX
MHPSLSSNPNVSIHVGDLTDIPLLASCLRDCNAVFSTVGSNTNQPGMSIAQRTAHSIVSALEVLREESRATNSQEPWKCPTVVMLSAAPLSPTLSAKMPKPAHWLLMTSCCYNFQDLRLATEYFRAHEWIPLILAHPGGIVHGKSQSVKLSTSENTPMISYAALAKGMVLMAEQDEKWIGQGVGLIADGMGFHFSIFGNVFLYLVPGLLYAFFPRAWNLIHK